jgi:hypothetical protein
MTGKVDLVATHVPVWTLDSPHAIASLVADMRQEIEAHKAQHQPPGGQLKSPS